MAKGDEYTPTPKVTDAPTEVTSAEIPTAVINDESTPVEDETSTIPKAD